MCDIYQLLTGRPEPFWLTYDCPKCKGGLSFRGLCEHGDVYSCSGCGFEEFVPYEEAEGQCASCAQWWKE